MDSITTLSAREPYVTKRHVAEYFGFTPRWVELRMAAGLPCYHFGTRVRFRLSEVEKYLVEAGVS